MLEVIRFIRDGIIQYIQNIVHLLIRTQPRHVRHLLSAGLIRWEHKISRWILRIIPVEGLHLLHVLEVTSKRNGHTLRDHSLHDSLTGLHLFRFGFVDNHRARVLKHDAVEGGLVGLVVDLDVLGVLPVDIDVVVVDCTDLSGDDRFGGLVVHWEFGVDDHPSEHVEGTGIPAFGDTRTVHLQQELLHIIQRDPRIGEVIHKITLNNQTRKQESPLEASVLLHVLKRLLPLLLHAESLAIALLSMVHIHQTRLCRLPHIRQPRPRQVIRLDVK